MADRLADTRRFYDLLDRLEGRIGGSRMLADCNGRMKWPNRGIYFFCEAGGNALQLGRRAAHPCGSEPHGLKYASAPGHRPVAIAFSEPVTGFELEYLVAGNGSAAQLQGNNATYTVTITPEASGTVTVGHRGRRVAGQRRQPERGASALAASLKRPPAGAGRVREAWSTGAPVAGAPGAVCPAGVKTAGTHRTLQADAEPH